MNSDSWKKQEVKKKVFKEKGKANNLLKIMRKHLPQVVELKKREKLTTC